MGDPAPPTATADTLTRRHHTEPLKAPARDILADALPGGDGESGALLGGDGSELELEDVELSSARFWQLALFAAACFMSSLDWTILVRGLVDWLRTKRHTAVKHPTRLRRRSSHSPLCDRRRCTPWEKHALTSAWSASTRCPTCVRCAACVLTCKNQSLTPLPHLHTTQAWNIYTAPGAILALWLTERAGLRVSLLWGYASGLACSVLAHLACALPLAPRAGFRLLYLSQALGAVGQPLYLNNVTLLAGAWFSASERDAAVAVSLLCVSFGSVFISAYAPLAVTTSSQVDLLFWWQVPIWIVILGFALVFTADQPDQPPNPAAAVQRAARRAAAKRRSFGAEDDAVAAVVLTWRQVVQLCSNQNFNILNLSSSIVVSTIYLVGTVAGQLLSPCGVSNFVVGLSLAAAALFTGIAVVAYIFILRRTTTQEAADADAHTHHAVETAPHPYKAHQVGWSLLAVAAIVPVLATATIGISPAAVITAWAALGLLSGTLVNGALTMEHAAEITFPLPANVSVNVLAITGSLISFVQVVIGTLLLEMPASATCSRVDTPFALFCFLNAGGGLALLAFLRPDYRRAEVEARVQRVADQRAAREEAEGGLGKGGAGAGAGYGAMRPLSSSGT